MATEAQILSREMAHAYLSGTIPVNPRLIQIPETTFNEKYRLIRGENYEKFDYYYAKQTQFPKRPNECKRISNKGL